MSNYSYQNSEVKEKGFISKEKILNYVTEEEIFKLVFKYIPIEFQYVTSPFRDDTRPSCWFERTYTGSLRFKDFGNNSKVNGIVMRNIGCFDAVQVYFDLPSFYHCLLFIKKHLIDGKELIPVNKVKTLTKKKNRVHISITTRAFDIRDKIFWSKYLISRQNLIDDNVFPVIGAKITGGNKGDFVSRFRDTSYVYTDFKDQRKKIYRPYKKGSKRFLTNCKSDDIGNINQLISFGKILIITKSYKDCRVLRNLGINCVWFQNEGMRPSVPLLIELCKRFEKVIVFYDNDKTGIEASIKISNEINTIMPNKSIPLYLPTFLLESRISDPSDLIHKKGIDSLIDFLKTNNLL